MYKCNEMFSTPIYYLFPQVGSTVRGLDRIYVLSQKTILVPGKIWNNPKEYTSSVVEYINILSPTAEKKKKMNLQLIRRKEIITQIIMNVYWVIIKWKWKAMQQQIMLKQQSSCVFIV